MKNNSKAKMFKVGKKYIISNDIHFKMCRGTDKNIITNKEDFNKLWYQGILFDTREFFEEEVRKYELTCIGFYDRESITDKNCF